MKRLYSSTVAITSSLLVALAVVGAEARLQANASAQARMTDRDFEGLKGRVKIVKEDRAKLVNKAGKLVEKDRSLYLVSNYDVNGYLTTEAFASTATSNSKTYYHYEKNGDRKGEAKIDTSSVAIPGEILPNLNITFTNTTRFKYDQEGRRIEEIIFRADGSMSWRNVYSYDSSGRRIGKNRYSQNRLVFRIAYSHDEQGNVSELTEYKSNGSVARKESYSYEFDSTGNWIKRVTSKWVTKDGKSFFEPSEVTYRKITCY